MDIPGLRLFRQFALLGAQGGKLVCPCVREVYQPHTPVTAFKLWLVNRQDWPTVFLADVQRDLHCALIVAVTGWNSATALFALFTELV